MELQQGILFHLMILYLFVTKGCSEICDDRCCLNYYKHRNGSCVECPLGTHGLNCSGTCVSGFHGRFCLSECECPVHTCDKKYGCLGDKVDERKGDKHVWTDVWYTLVGSFTTLGIVGLMIYLKSWCSKRSVSSQETNQNDIAHPGFIFYTKNHEENPYEIYRNSSSSESDDVIRGQATNSDDYTDLRFFRIEPEQCTTSSMEDDTKPQFPSNATIPENSHHDEDTNDAGENNGLADSSAMNGQYSDEVVGEYDYIEMNHNKESPQEMERIQSEEEAVRQSLIDETVNEYILLSQTRKERDMPMKFDIDKEIFQFKVKSKSLPPGKVSHKEVLPTHPWSVTKGHRHMGLILNTHDYLFQTPSVWRWSDGHLFYPLGLTPLNKSSAGAHGDEANALTSELP
ncbi:uncharacterized protein LOC125664242 [Ostrea edulis]|uniref:uncharacterized protein LOC125664242 n=1 Tax=Ostrea edulis TaxID=37623 RepID=UPI0024AFA2DE|nr:uncharacterized protein LOC125664242 [Ostrea edulis]